MTSVHSLKGEATGKIKLPEQFNEEYRPDIIKRAVLALQTHKIQPTAPMLHAGNFYSTYLSKRRHEYKSTYGSGRSRTPRTVVSRKGSRFNFRGAQVPQTVGGRVAHPPRIWKVIIEKINDKERKKAIRSALMATTMKNVVLAHGHRIEKLKELPIVMENNIEDLSKTKDVKDVLMKLGLQEELMRTKEKKIRPGKGKMRGRVYRKKVGPLFIVSKKCNLLHSAKNVAGVDAVDVKSLNAELLAPGAKPGRLTIWSEAALKELGEKKLFM
jgi:large subunit ribosomal protein L4e